MNLLLKILILFISIFTLSCTEKIYYSGKILSNDINFKSFKNKNELVSAYGNPSMIDPIQKKYYYYTEKKIITNFFDQKIDERTMIVFTLDKNENISDSMKYDLSDYRNINIFNRTTENNIVEKGFIEKVFGGIGKTSLPNAQ